MVDEYIISPSGVCVWVCVKIQKKSLCRTLSVTLNLLSHVEIYQSDFQRRNARSSPDNVSLKKIWRKTYPGSESGWVGGKKSHFQSASLKFVYNNMGKINFDANLAAVSHVMTLFLLEARTGADFVSIFFHFQLLILFFRGRNYSYMQNYFYVGYKIDGSIVPLMSFVNVKCLRRSHFFREVRDRSRATLARLHP